jgi:hypothetical protein
MIHSIIIIVFPKVVDAENVSEAPQAPDQILRDTLSYHVEMDSVRPLAPTHVDHNPSVRRVVFEPTDVQVPDSAGLLERMYLTLIVEGKSAIKRGWPKILIEQSGVFPARNPDSMEFPLLLILKAEARLRFLDVRRSFGHIINFLLTHDP